jgi:hypothetical protein
VQDEYELIHSPLCRTVTDAGHTIQVEICRGLESNWILEVVDEFNNSRVWDVWSRVAPDQYAESVLSIWCIGVLPLEHGTGVGQVQQ